MATNPAEILKDPDFQGLNLAEKGKVLARIDPDYANLSPMEQQKFMARITAPSKSAPEGTSVSAPERSGVNKALQTVRDYLPDETTVAKGTMWAGKNILGLEPLGDYLGKEAAYQSLKHEGIDPNVLEEGGIKPTTGERVGAGLQGASVFLPYGKIAGAGTAMAGKVLSPAVAKYAGTALGGATGGYLNEAGAKISRGEAPTPGMTTLLGAAIPPAVQGGVSKLGKYLYPELKGTVEHGISKGIRPSVASRGQSATQKTAYFEKAQNAVETIIGNKENLVFTDAEGNAVKGALPKSLNDFSQAIDQTKKSIFTQYDAMAKAAGKQGAKVELAPVTKELDTIVNSNVLKDLSPETVVYAQARIENLSQRGTYTAGEAQDAIQNLNNSLKAFYKNPTYDNASKAGVDAIIANNLRKSLDDVIEKTSGEGYQALKNQYGALKAIEKDVNRRATVDARQSPKGFFDITDIVSGAELIRGVATMNPADVASGVVMRGIKSYIKRVNNPNRVVASMFEKADKVISGGAVKPSWPRTPGDLLADLPDYVKSQVKGIFSSGASPEVKKRWISNLALPEGIKKSLLASPQGDYGTMKAMSFKDFIKKTIRDEKGLIGKDINRDYELSFKNDAFDTHDGDAWLARKSGYNPFNSDMWNNAKIKGVWKSNDFLVNTINAPALFESNPKLKTIKTKILINPSGSNFAKTLINIEKLTVSKIEVFAKNPVEAERLLRHEIIHADEITNGIKPDFVSDPRGIDFLYPEKVKQYFESETEKKAWGEYHPNFKKDGR